MKVMQGLVVLVGIVLLIGHVAQAQTTPTKKDQTKKDTSTTVKSTTRINITPPPARSKKKTKPDSLHKPLRLAGFRLGADILPTAFGTFDQRFTSYQGTFEVLLNNKYFIELSGGVEQRIRQGVSNYTYSSQGFYGRMGINYNMLHRKSKDDAIYVGLHFGYARFDNDISYTITNTANGGDASGLIIEKQLMGTWLEGNFGFKVELFNNLYMGPMFRVKIKLTGSEGELLYPNDIPGYGVNNAANFAFGYHILYRIPFKSKKRKRRVIITPSTPIKKTPPNPTPPKKDKGDGR
ncbi:DUF6048 family protein [Microscilla marina]|uniref:Outer membrane protein beta-barrel domain-containing protein n=1 Tax=Microscilla marina ATCC 23134 TaxID=313606 RepID=A1ZSH7_MICM2|nr:DUF6048 family protein [Microscilla marina]EAY26725.1 hypothetical protein M23134_02976 [Microscilla marina ATCC 23134]